jgi:hypothetical protein
MTSAQETSDKQTVTDVYAYLLGRALAIRQEYTDLKEPGVAYNVIKYNPVGSADFVNPNLDVAYFEAWIAVDDQTSVLLEVPEVKGRYYTAQILDEWGEVITNINERNYPSHAFGNFVLVAPGSRVNVPADAVRIELHSRKAKLLGRVELKTDPAGAVALQKQFKVTVLGTPVIEPTAPMVTFGNNELIGVELFDNIDKVIASAQDLSPIAAQMQAKARDIGQQAKNPKSRKMLEKLIKEEVVPQFLNYAVTKSAVFKDHWLGGLGCGNFGVDYWLRSSTNLVGIWANTNDEVIYFVGIQDADGQPLNGSNDYVLDFPESGRPDVVVNGYWSVILVDLPNYRVVPNPMNRFNFNSYSGLKNDADGSLKILVSSKPNAAMPESNWLPAPVGKAFSLTLRAYVPKDVVKRGDWFPPAIKRI